MSLLRLITVVQWTITDVGSKLGRASTPLRLDVSSAVLHVCCELDLNLSCTRPEYAQMTSTLRSKPARHKEPSILPQPALFAGLLPLK